MNLLGSLKSHLNKNIWKKDKSIHSDVEKSLRDIAKDFMKSLGVKAPIIDIILTGSMANYNHNKQSDIDVHIVVDLDKFGIQKDLAAAFFDASRRIWNKAHNITVKGHDVEIYVQPEQELPKNAASYSLINSRWLAEPVKISPNYDKEVILKKVKDLSRQIDDAESKNYSLEELNKLKKKISKMRKAGLKSGGEMSNENLIFKVLRRNGYLQKLFKALNTQYDRSMSIIEKRR
jgi:predicted nucleotidyltransferase